MTIALLRAGQKKERLPDGENVIRLIKKTTNDGKISPDEFELSTEDKKSELKSLSVWADKLTTPEQAREFMGKKKESYSLFCVLNVDEVRALRPDPDNVDVSSLDVVWDPLTLLQEDGTELPDSPSGAEGHSGITGLMRVGLPRISFFSLRSQLADHANGTLKSIA